MLSHEMAGATVMSSLHHSLTGYLELWVQNQRPPLRARENGAVLNGCRVGGKHLPNPASHSGIVHQNLGISAVQG